MELLYLWVEEYKNIHRQGFNFSSRFRCAYDSESNELTIDNNPEHIENFFGDNINITAIVGKNGSGKSSVLELIMNYDKAKFFADKNFFIVYCKDDKFYGLYSGQCPNQIDNTFVVNFSYHEERISRINSSDNNWHIGTYEVASTKPISGNITYKRLDGSTHSNMLQKTDHYYLSDNQFFIHKYIDVYVNHKQILEKLKDICVFDILQIKLKYRKVQIFDAYYPHTSDTKNILDVSKEIMSKFSEEQELAKQKFPYTPEYYMNYKRILAPSLFIAVINYFISNTPSGSKDLYEILSNQLNLLNENIDNSTIDFKVHLEIYKFIENIEDTIRKVNTDVNLHEAIKFLIDLSEVSQEGDIFYYDFDLNTITSKTINLINKLASMFSDNDIQLEKESLRLVELDLVNSQTKARYNTISDGEKQFLKIAIDFFTKLPYVTKMTRNRSHIFLSDEIDESLHPLWKKNLISHLLDILKVYTNNNENIFLHFIFTTHSPFLLSDIPKQNIIFLDTYKEEDEEVKNGKQKVGNCKVVDGLKEKKQTFGANIHTLLSDSFFMEDGLMGEFAKGKIDKIIKYLRENKIPEPRETWVESKENLKKIIETIGEPFLRHKVLELYYDKFTDDTTKKERKKELEKQKKQIESELSKYD